MKANRVIKEHIENHNIDKYCVADKIGMPHDTFQRMLSGKRRLKAEEFVKICVVLSLDIKDFT